MLVISVRNGGSDAYQQVHRVNPVAIDFKAGGNAERIQQDRRRMLLHRLFDNRLQIADGAIESLVAQHVSEYFRPDADGEVAAYLKQTFASGRSKAGMGDTGRFVPPVALPIDSPHGPHLLALGRRKWKSQGCYPTLTHGGLSLLEVLSPFVELSKTGC